MTDEKEPTPLANIHPRDQSIVRSIDAVLASYAAVLPSLLAHPDAQYVAEPTEIDRSPHPNHGVPESVRNAGLVAVRDQVL